MTALRFRRAAHNVNYPCGRDRDVAEACLRRWSLPDRAGELMNFSANQMPTGDCGFHNVSLIMSSN